MMDCFRFPMSFQQMLLSIHTIHIAQEQLFGQKQEQREGGAKGNGFVANCKGGVQKGICTVDGSEIPNNHASNYQPQLVMGGFLNHQLYEFGMELGKAGSS